MLFGQNTDIDISFIGMVLSFKTEVVYQNTIRHKVNKTEVQTRITLDFNSLHS